MICYSQHILKCPSAQPLKLLEIMWLCRQPQFWLIPPPYLTLNGLPMGVAANGKNGTKMAVGHYADLPYAILRLV